MLIKLSGRHWINAQQIREVKMDSHARVSVVTLSGEVLGVEAVYGQGPYQTLDRIVGLINSVTSNEADQQR